MPCRCGQSWTCGPSPRSGTSGQLRAGVERLDVEIPRSRGGDGRVRTTAGLPQVRRAGHVGDDAAGAGRVQTPRAAAGAAGRTAGRRRPGSRRHRPRAGGAARRGRCRGRRPGRGRRSPAAPGRARCCRRRWRARHRRRAGRRRRARRGAARSRAASRRGTALAARPASSAALPPGPAHDVQPAARPGRPAGRGEGERDELAALVLHARGTGADLGEVTRVAPGQDGAVRGQRRRLAPAAVSLVRAARPGRATRVTRGRDVVRGQGRRRPRPSPRPARRRTR